MNSYYVAVPPAVPLSNHAPRRDSPIVSSIPPQVLQQPPAPTPALPSTPVESSPPQIQSAPARQPFLPWYSAPNEPFPRRRRKRRIPVAIAAEPATKTTTAAEESVAPPPPSEEPTPSTTQPPSESGSTQFTNPATPTSITPTSTAPPSAPPSTTNTAPHKPVPIVPAVPILPLTPPAVPIIAPNTGKPVDSKKSSPQVPKESKDLPEEASVTQELKESKNENEIAASAAPSEVSEAVLKPAKPVQPKSWADLMKTENANGTNGALVTVVKANGTSNGKVGSLADALVSFNVGLNGVPTPFLEPRGLINAGNMCYMNAVLQMLVFCGPFYTFLDGLGKQVAHSFKSDTPLLDAMIMFMREFRPISSQKPLPEFKEKDLEAFGEPFVPEYVYEVTRTLKSFSHMRRGHQQDAEEFLGFLLDGLHEEAVKVIKSAGAKSSPITNGHGATENEAEVWLEVGSKQKTAITRKTEITESPITKIFGGQLRSVLRVPGHKDSATTEPYTPLQLDIQAPEVRSVIDALKHMTVPEKLHGNFKDKGSIVEATKQVYIETLPQVLILHLKRFQYDNTGGTQKIWKKIGYPLLLEIPREVMSVKRANPPAKYRLIGVVYHHGKSASGGHYTVDVLRQDAKSWIRIDDTVIKRIRGDEVAVDVKDIGSFNNLDGEDHDGWVNGWEEVSGSGPSSKPESPRYVGKDSKEKVAYILFYEKL
ncbi:hypothetical protein RUND412_002599 [Rhizina undulata]